MPNILELLQNHSITPKKVSTTKGGEYHSPCPTCGGEDRFHVWPAQNNGLGSYWCRGCGSGGDCIQFLIDFDSRTFRQAKLELGIDDAECRPSIDRRRAQASVTKVWQPENKTHPADVIDLPKWIDHATKFIDICHTALLSSSANLEWLHKRGIPLESIKKFKLGWHATKELKNSYRPRESWGLTGGINPKTKRPRMLLLPAGLVVPWIVDGVVRRIQIRLAKKDQKFPKKKYHAVVGSAMDTFMTSWIAQAYVTVETVLDAIMIDAQAGDMIGAAALISSHAKPTITATRALRRADIILGALDFDHAGSAASSWWPKNFTNFVRHPVPQGGDPGEAYEQGVNIRQWLKLGMPESLIISNIDDVLDFDAYNCELPKSEECQPLPVVVKRPGQHRDVNLLASLLNQCPVCIQNTSTTLGIRKLINFDTEKHGPLKRRISQLVFGSDPVFDYLTNHPEKLISAGNFLINATRR